MYDFMFFGNRLFVLITFQIFSKIIFSQKINQLRFETFFVLIPFFFTISLIWSLVSETCTIYYEG